MSILGLFSTNNASAQAAPVVQQADVDAALIAHAAKLDALFNDAFVKYAEADTTDKARIYGGLALKAQNYFRMTTLGLVRFKRGEGAEK